MNTINGRGYTQYKIYQGAFYPLNSETIVFPSVNLEMIKFRIAKNPSFWTNLVNVVREFARLRPSLTQLYRHVVSTPTPAQEVLA